MLKKKSKDNISHPGFLRALDEKKLKLKRKLTDAEDRLKGEEHKNEPNCLQSLESKLKDFEAPFRSPEKSIHETEPELEEEHEESPIVRRSQSDFPTHRSDIPTVLGPQVPTAAIFGGQVGDCLICTERFTNQCVVRLLDCDTNHHFHSACLLREMEAKGEICPKCSKPIDSSLAQQIRDLEMSSTSDR